MQHSPGNRPLVVFTDSKNALLELQHCQRSVFRAYQTPRESQKPLHSLIEALNHNPSRPVVLVKVRAHKGHRLNEWADSQADAAAKAADREDIQVISLAEGPTHECKLSYQGEQPTSWNPRLSARLEQEQVRRALQIPRTPRFKGTATAFEHMARAAT